MGKVSYNHGSGTLGAGQYNSSAPTLNDQDEIVLQVDNAGNLLVKTVNTGSGSNPAAGATGSAVPADADYQGVNIGGNLVGATGLAVGSAKAQHIAIVDGSGNQVTSFGGSASAIASNYHKLAAATNNADTIKASAGTLFGIHVFNLAGYPVYIKIYNKASNPAPGSDTVFRTIAVQAGTHRDVSIPAGLTMATGIAIAMVKLISETDNTSLAASDCVVDVEYT